MPLRSLCVFISLALSTAGCADSRGGGGSDAGPVAPPGGVALTVTAASYRSVDTVALQVVVTNGVGGRPAPLAASAFSLDTDGGAVLQALASASDCPEGISVAAGASLGCTVAFAVPAGHAPTTVHYEADAERRASAAVPRCPTPGGLCEPGRACRGGACVPACSSTVPDGACTADSERCVAGVCRPPCSSSEPGGWCDEGVCVSGECDASCFSGSFVGECPGCLQSALEEECYDERLEEECLSAHDCLYCPLSSSTTCECATYESCVGCVPRVREVWSCLRRRCPQCANTSG